MNSELLRVYATFLGKMIDTESALVSHLPIMIMTATRKDLKETLSEHLTETKQQKIRAQELLATHSTIVSNEITNEPFRQWLQEIESTTTTITDTEARDEFILASAQAVEHYEIATYESLCLWATKLHEDDAYSTLSVTLIEEETALADLAALANGDELDEILDELTSR